MRKSRRANKWKVLDQSFFSMFITFSLIELTNVASSLIDGLIVSRFLSAESMAAAGIVQPVFSIAGIFGGMFAAGMQAMCTKEMGRTNVAGFNRIFSMTVYFGTALSVFLIIAMLWAAEPMVMFLGASGDGAALTELASQYLRGILIGLPALIMTGVLASAVQMDSGRKRVMRASVIYSVCNVLFDLAAIRLHLGMFGIGLATAAAQYCSLGVLSLHFREKEKMLRFVAPEFSKKETLEFLSSGTEKSLRRLSNVIRPVILNKLILFYGGAMAMTAMSIQNSVYGFTAFFAVGLTDATALIVGVLFGEMNEDRIVESVKTALRCCGIFCGAICILFLVFARPIARLYIPEDGELLELTVFAVRMVALMAPLSGILQPRISYLQAIAHIRNMQMLTIISKLVYVLLSAFLLGSAFGTYGILASYLVSDFLSLMTIRLYYSVKKRKVRVTLPGFLDLPSSFRRKPGDVIDLDIRSLEDVSLTSEQIKLFCNGHKTDSSVGFKTALCFEELASNIIRHGFPECKEDPGIDLRIVYDPSGLIIRIQDNCPAFNVERHIAMAVSENTDCLEENLGLRLLGGMASDIKYVHSLETNNTIMRFPI